MNRGNMEIKPIHKVISLYMVLVIGCILELTGRAMFLNRVEPLVGSPAFSAGIIVSLMGVILHLGVLIIVWEDVQVGRGSNQRKPLRMLNSKSDGGHSNQLVLITAILSSVILSMFVITNYSITGSEKYDLLRDLLMIVIGILAAIGFGIFKWIERKVKDLMLNERQVLNNDRRALAASISRLVGHTFWLFFDSEYKKAYTNGTPSKETLEHLTRLLSRAKLETDKSLKEIERISPDDRQYEIQWNLTVNNLLYYTAESVRVGMSEYNNDEIRTCYANAKSILTNVSKENYPLDFHHYHESASWALYHVCGEMDPKSKEKACAIIQGLFLDPDVPQMWCDEFKERWKGCLTESECNLEDTHTSKQHDQK